MEKVKKTIIRVTDKLEESCVLGAIRQRETEHVN